jgi:predicted dehydrogenase
VVPLGEPDLNAQAESVEIPAGAATVLPGFRNARVLRVGFVGCGDHSFRNIYPALRYCPVELVAVCDRDRDRAEQYRVQFGAGRSMSNPRELLAEGLDAVFVVTGYEPIDGGVRTTHADLACDFLAAGVSTWVEKPPANDLREIRALRDAKQEGGAAAYAVGYKKAFTPATRHVVRLMQRPEFGSLTTMTARYPQPIPSPNDEPGGLDVIGFLDHVSHPTALIRALAGPTRSISYVRTADGTGFITFFLEQGAIASLHLGPYSYRPGLAERTEVNGHAASIVVENNVRVIWYPGGEIAPYGQAADFTDWAGVTQWEPEFSLGQLYNKGLFMLGYHGELAQFCEAVLAGHDVELGGIDAAEEHLRIFSAIRRSSCGEIVELAGIES